MAPRAGTCTCSGTGTPIAGKNGKDGPEQVHVPAQVNRTGGTDGDEVVKTSPCKGCGRPILWATDAEGKAIPLDPRAPIYFVQELEDGRCVATLQKKEAEDVPVMRSMVSHFSTCSKAAQFSRGGKQVKA